MGQPYGEHELAASQDVVQEGVVPADLKGIRASVGPHPSTWRLALLLATLSTYKLWGIVALCPETLVRWSRRPKKADDRI